MVKTTFLSFTAEFLRILAEFLRFTSVNTDYSKTTEHQCLLWNMVGVGSGVGIFHGGDNKKRPAGGQPADLRDWVVCAVLRGNAHPQYSHPCVLCQISTVPPVSRLGGS